MSSLKSILRFRIPSANELLAMLKSVAEDSPKRSSPGDSNVKARSADVTGKRLDSTLLEPSQTEMVAGLAAEAEGGSAPAAAAGISQHPYADKKSAYSLAFAMAHLRLILAQISGYRVSLLRRGKNK